MSIRSSNKENVGFINTGKMNSELNREIPIDDPSQTVLHKEMLQSSMAGSRDVQCSAESIDFGFTNLGRISDSRQLTL